MRLRLITIAFLGLSFSSCSSEVYIPQHPLDPLSNAEFIQIQEVLGKAGHFTETTWFAQISLHEPAKSYVRHWSVGDPLQRAANVVVRQDHKTYEAIVDLETGSLKSWEHIANSQPNLMNHEFKLITDLVKAHPAWQHAMKRRGVESFRRVHIDAQFAGYFGEEGTEFRRLAVATSFDLRRVRNFYGRPIEGVTAVVDLDSEKIIEFTDPEIIPIPDADVDYHEKAVGKLRNIPTALGFSQTGGPSFSLDGHTVNWQNWSFHHRIDPRVGQIVSLVSYNDRGRKREILYQGNISEIFVPYQDATKGWYHRTFLDSAEYSAGGLVYGLKPDRDCPSNAVYFNTEVGDDRGYPKTRKRAACLFERPTGNPSWRHDHSITGRIESRRQRELVLRMIAVVGNYDYVVDWIFSQAGALTIAVGATGIVSVKAVTSRTSADGTMITDDQYGRFVSPNIVAVNHGHFFNFRFDLDVDGPANSFSLDALKTMDLGPDSPRRSVWKVESTIAKTESDAQTNKNISSPRMWRFINPNVEGPVGYPTSFAIVPNGVAMPLLLPEDYGQRRGAFTEYNLWVTPNTRDERYAAGRFPAQSSGRQGLPAWTQQDRSIENTDIVAWYNLGVHHVVRAEDWPVMPIMWRSVTLLPFDFFDRNPAIDLPQ